MGHKLRTNPKLHQRSFPVGSDLPGRVVVITGAATALGSSVAREFARSGASIVLGDRQADSLEILANECDLLGGRALVVPTDLSSEFEVEALARQAIAIFGWIDVWVNDRSMDIAGNFGDVPLADQVQVIQADLLGTLFGSYFAYRQFMRQGSGTLINIASDLGGVAVPLHAAPAAAVHGIAGLTASLRQEVLQNPALRDRIRICLVRTRADSADAVGAVFGLAVDPGRRRDAVRRASHTPPTAGQLHDGTAPPPATGEIRTARR
jgi:NAD(P)-dependent dehydrogenase (short-subunit alcohol dehydrogenase family)